MPRRWQVVAAEHRRPSPLRRAIFPRDHRPRSRFGPRDIPDDPGTSISASHRQKLELLAWIGLDSGGAVKDRRRACWRVLVRDRQSTVEMDVVHNDRIRTLCGYVEAKHGGSIPRKPQLHWASSRAAGKTAPCAD